MRKICDRKTIKIDPEIHAKILVRAKAEGRKVEIVVDRLLKAGFRVMQEDGE